ncbi:MAG: hypothetical protein JWO53_1105 [Chlamydiia bacterium]|nr:hypothetical protein [Chlamydiia bacterium]
MNKSPTWILVMNGSRAKVYQLTTFPKIAEVTTFEHPETRLHTHDVYSSKPGRVFQRGGSTRHGYEGTEEYKEIEKEKFAKTLAHHLSTAFQKGEFLRLYIMASPALLGSLRKVIEPQIYSSAVVGEIAKDMTAHTVAEIEEHLTNL